MAGSPTGDALLWSEPEGPWESVGREAGTEVNHGGRELGVAEVCSFLGTFKHRDNEIVHGVGSGKQKHGLWGRKRDPLLGMATYGHE